MIGKDFSKLGEESASLPFDLGTQVLFLVSHLLQFQFSYFFIPFFIFRSTATKFFGFLLSTPLLCFDLMILRGMNQSFQ